MKKFRFVAYFAGITLASSVVFTLRARSSRAPALRDAGNVRKSGA